MESSVSSQRIHSTISSSQLTIDIILYPTHVSFGGDKINSGLAFVLLLMITTTIVPTKFRILGNYCDLSLTLLISAFLYHFSVTIFLLNAHFWDALYAIYEIMPHPPELQSR